MSSASFSSVVTLKPTASPLAVPAFSALPMSSTIWKSACSSRQSRTARHAERRSSTCCISNPSMSISSCDLKVIALSRASSRGTVARVRISCSGRSSAASSPEYPSSIFASSAVGTISLTIGSTSSGSRFSSTSISASRSSFCWSPSVMRFMTIPTPVERFGSRRHTFVARIFVEPSASAAPSAVEPARGLTTGLANAHSSAATSISSVLPSPSTASKEAPAAPAPKMVLLALS